VRGRGASAPARRRLRAGPGRGAVAGVSGQPERIVDGPLPRLDGRRVLVTGATSGIGRETALRLAALGAEVAVHGRDMARGAAVLAAVREAAGASRGRLYLADLSTLDGVRRLAAIVRRDLPALDVLVANAGVYSPERVETADGLELTFAVNVVAPILLAVELLPALRRAAPARIVVVGSASHWTGEIHWDDLQWCRRPYDGVAVYDQSKLAVTMLTFALARRLRGSGVTAVCLDPGDVDTAMLRAGWPELEGVPVEEGATTSIWLAAAEEAAALHGVYLEDGRVTEPLAAARDEAAQERLWQALEGITGPLAV